jgi:hypothetical protein
MTTMVLLVIAAAIAAAIFASIFNDGESRSGAGRVWSAEHGHYHDG